MLVLSLSNSPLAAGLVVCAAIVPSMIVYIPAGALVDRFRPLRVMFLSEIGRGIAIGSVIVPLALRGSLSIWFLICAMVVEEILEIFSMLADRRYASYIVDRDATPGAQARIEVRTHAAVVAGRPIGPYLFEMDKLLPFALDAVSFLVSVVSIVVIKCKEVKHPEPRDADPVVRHHRPIEKPRLRKDIHDGVNSLWRDKTARLTMVLMAGTTLIAQALILIFLSEAHAHRLSSLAVGVGLAASGVGGAVGSVGFKRISLRVRSCWLQMRMCAWAMALFFLAVSGGQSFFWMGVAMLVLGLTGSIGNITFASYLVHRFADENMLARVTSIGQVLAIGASALGPLLGGWAFQHWGIRGSIFVLSGIVMFLCFISLGRPGLRADLIKLLPKAAE
jgi:MFS family permease